MPKKLPKAPLVYRPPVPKPEHPDHFTDGTLLSLSAHAESLERELSRATGCYVEAVRQQCIDTGRIVLNCLEPLGRECGKGPKWTAAVSAIRVRLFAIGREQEAPVDVTRIRPETIADNIENLIRGQVQVRELLAEVLRRATAAPLPPPPFRAPRAVKGGAK